ncbi:uncharacterized protein METZ01_LOCUS485658 [marine metagenome]|uniref:Uncharacterized protein n=1 Tax=marine metagenome TaxID=408172 RepID=A0A383CKZ3_9ZZZZ
MYVFFLQAAAVEVVVRADGQDRSGTEFLVESAFGRFPFRL